MYIDFAKEESAKKLAGRINADRVVYFAKKTVTNITLKKPQSEWSVWLWEFVFAELITWISQDLLITE